MTLDARKDRTELRLKLYENGFTPLANKSKLCLIKGWSTIEITKDLIQSKATNVSGPDGLPNVFVSAFVGFRIPVIGLR